MRPMSAGLAIAMALAPAPSWSQSRDALSGAARAFDESALRLGDDNARPTSIRKWLEPIKLGFDNPATNPALVDITRQALKEIAAIAGVSVVESMPGDKTANFIVYFDENGVNGQSGYCFANSWWKGWAINRGELRVNPTRINDIDRCATHETMHAFGFSSHPHAADSVLSYVNHARRKLSPLDLDLIRTLYDKRLPVGLKPGPASQQACRILGERMASSPADVEAVCRERSGPVK